MASVVMRSANSASLVLRDLLMNDCIAVHLSGVFEPPWCEMVASWFERHPSRRNFAIWSSENGFVRSGTDRVGSPLTSWNPEIVDSAATADVTERVCRHEEAVSKLKGDYQGQFAVEEFPAETAVRLLLSNWTSGSELLQVGGFRSSSCVVRILDEEPGNASPQDDDPHVDRSPYRMPPFDLQLSVVVYLKMPSQGGELEIWSLPRREFSLLVRGDATLPRVALPSPTIIRPSVGDVVVFDSQRPHSVGRVRGGSRVVQACFLGFMGSGAAKIWS